jgi:hypothetical protein
MTYWDLPSSRAMSTYLFQLYQKMYGDVAMVLQWCHSGITVVLQWFHSGVTVLPQWCDPVLLSAREHVIGPKSIQDVHTHYRQFLHSIYACILLHWCYTIFTLLLPCSYTLVTLLLHY